jgi:N-acylglucosamine 2-epimerase
MHGTTIVPGGGIMIQPDKQFVYSHQTEILSIREIIRKDLEENILPFWENRVLDPQDGGYCNFFDCDGNLYDVRKPGWFMGRNLYIFSRLFNEGYGEKWRPYADAGYQFLWRAEADGNRFNYLLGKKAEILTGPVSIYTDHFALDGLFEYYKACGSSLGGQALDKNKILLDALLDRISDSRFLHEKEGITAGWMKHSINFITLLVTMNSREIFGPVYESVLDECVRRSLYCFASDKYQNIFEYIGENEQPKPEDKGRIVDCGHAMEALWFSMRDGVMRNKEVQLKRAEVITDWITETCIDRENGGFFQHIDFETQIPRKEQWITMYGDVSVPWDAQIWWVQAESLIALAYSAVYNGNKTHWTHFQKLLSYTRDFFLDTEKGEWFSLLNRDNTILDANKGSLLKGPYHVPRCLLELSSLFDTCISIAGLTVPAKK